MFDDDLLKLINQCHLKYVKKRHRRFLVLSKGFLPYICYYKTDQILRNDTCSNFKKGTL